MPVQLARPVLGTLLSVVTVLCGAPAHADQGGPRELVFLTWVDYIDPGVVQDFEQRFDARVRFVYFESDDDRDRLMVDNNGRGYDVILVNDITVQTYERRRWLAALGGKRIPNLRHLDPRWTDAFPSTARCAVPYLWGSFGIAYRRDHLPEGLSSWRALLQPPERLRGRIAMTATARELVGLALKAAGHSANSGERQALDQAEHLLLTQRPYVRDYSYVTLDESSALVRGDIWATPLYSGDALVLQTHASEIAYRIPREGGLLWVDYLTVAQASTHKDLAMAFLNFLTGPKVAARLARSLRYATPNRGAKAHLPAEYFANPVIYPGAEELARSEFLERLPPGAQKRVNAIGALLLD